MINIKQTNKVGSPCSSEVEHHIRIPFSNHFSVMMVFVFALIQSQVLLHPVFREHTNNTN